MPTREGWRSVSYIAGGPGRIRTTDARIFNTIARPERYSEQKSRNPRLTLLPVTGIPTDLIHWNQQ
jgi:hypothetical protein